MVEKRSEGKIETWREEDLKMVDDTFNEEDGYVIIGTQRSFAIINMKRLSSTSSMR